MTRHIILFLGTFAAGAMLALVVRSAVFQPHARQEAAPHAASDYRPMVSASAIREEGAAPHAAHTANVPAPAAGQPVNTVCSICGMPVDPELPTAEYQGKTIGFGCRMCPPKFKANPDRYGPSYLRNEVVER